MSENKTKTQAGPSSKKEAPVKKTLPGDFEKATNYDKALWLKAVKRIQGCIKKAKTVNKAKMALAKPGEENEDDGNNEYFEAALAMTEKLHEKTFSILKNLTRKRTEATLALSELWIALEVDDKALECLLASREAALARFEPKSKDLVDFSLAHAMACAKINEHKLALKSAKVAGANLKDTQPEKKSRALMILSHALAAMDRTAEAVPFMEQALQLVMNAAGRQSEPFFMGAMELADIYTKAKLGDKAYEMWDGLITDAKNMNLRDPKLLFDLNKGKAEAMMEQKRYGPAARAVKKMIKELPKQALGGPEHFAVAGLYIRALAHSEGKMEEAVAEMDKLGETALKQHGEGSEGYGAFLRDRGIFFLNDAKDYEKAKEAFEQSNEIVGAKFGEDSMEYHGNLMMLADVYAGLEDKAKALSLMEAVIAFAEEEYGKGTRDWKKAAVRYNLYAPEDKRIDIKKEMELKKISVDEEIEKDKQAALEKAKAVGGADDNDEEEKVEVSDEDDVPQ